jgi:hypothetical protein
MTKENWSCLVVQLNDVKPSRLSQLERIWFILSRVGVTTHGYGLVNEFVDHLYIQLGTTSNYSTTADLHNWHTTAAPAKSFPACCVFSSRSLATASNCGYSCVSALRLSLHSLQGWTLFLKYQFTRGISHQPPSLPFTVWLSTEHWNIKSNSKLKLLYDGRFTVNEYAWPFVKCTFRTYSMLLKILPFALHTSPLSVQALRS